MIPVIWWSNNADVHPEVQWDSGLLHRLFDQGVPGFTFQDGMRGDLTPDQRHAVVVIAARHHYDDVNEINDFIACLDGVVLVLLGDEESSFPWREIVHPRIRFWVMMPHPVKHADMAQWAYFFGTGYKQDTPDLLSADPPSKDLPWAFAGQSTHARRQQAVSGLRRAASRVPGALEPTRGFTQGLPRGEYMELLSRSKVAPCPSGPVTADTMRLYEALEAGCLPIVDTGPEGSPLGFWEFCYGPDHPLIVVHDWGSVGGVIEAEISKQRWPRNANVVSAWWMKEKRDMARRLRSDLIAVGAEPRQPDWWEKVTVIITTSAIPSHPSMDFLDDTMASVYESFDLDTVQIIITCDGARIEQPHLADGYHEYVRRVCWRAQHEWNNVHVIVSREHRHQAGMLKLALAEVDTSVILLVEHDAPFSREPSDFIAWDRCIELVDYGAVDILRYHHEAAVHKEHAHLMLDQETREMLGVPLRRTVQYSARPHLARTDYYREVMERHFPDTANCFVEDKLHGTVLHDTTMRHNIAIYHPEGSIRRTLHTDGRAGELKLDGLQKFR